MNVTDPSVLESGERKTERNSHFQDFCNLTKIEQTGQPEFVYLHSWHAIITGAFLFVHTATKTRDF